MALYQEERLAKILKYLAEHKRISAEDICRLYEVSRDTARRDLVKLEEQNKIVRTHGGAILTSLQKEVKSYQERLKYGLPEKHAIGKLAASLIRSGDKVILDSSTTVQACAECITVEDCTIITNSINQAEQLAAKPGLNIQLLGGFLNKEHLFLYGSQVIAALGQYLVNKAFIGAVGISEKGLTTAYEEDGHVIRKMMAQAEQVIVLVDHTKFGGNGYFKYADLAEVDIIITNQLPDQAFLELLEKNNIMVMTT
jgi:DeoR/GlpR family transcriptional regulator of sugar metabolism